MPFRGAKRSINARYDTLRDEVGLSRRSPARENRSVQSYPSKYRSPPALTPVSVSHGSLSRFLCDAQVPPQKQERLPLQVRDAQDRPGLTRFGNEKEQVLMRQQASSDVHAKIDTYLNSDDSADDYNQQSKWFSSSQPPAISVFQGRERSPDSATADGRPLPFSRNPKRVHLDEDAVTSSSPIVHRPFGKRVKHQVPVSLTMQAPSTPVQYEQFAGQDWLSDGELVQTCSPDVPDASDSPARPMMLSSDRNSCPHAGPSRKRQLYIEDAEAKYRQLDETLPSHVSMPISRRPRRFDPTVFARCERKSPELPQDDAKLANEVKMIDLTSSDGPEATRSSIKASQTARQPKPSQPLAAESKSSAQSNSSKAAAMFSETGVFVPSWAQLPPSKQMSATPGTAQRQGKLAQFFSEDMAETDEDLLGE